MAVKNFVEEMKKWGSMKQNGVRQMKNFWGHFSSKNLLIPVQFVHEELLPIRIARGVLELEDCPYGLSKELGVVKVPDLHLDSFHVLQSYPEIKDKNDEFKFTKMVKTITLRHNNVVPMMALGVKQLKKEQPQFSYEDLGKIQQLLDRFYMSKVGLNGQHLPLHDANPLPNSVGYIHAKMSPLEVARDASKDAQGIRLHEYGSSAVEVKIYGHPDSTFPTTKNLLDKEFTTTDVHDGWLWTWRGFADYLDGRLWYRCLPSFFAVGR